MMSDCKTPFTHCLSHVSVCRAPNNSRRHRISSSHCLIALQTTAGTPATMVWGRKASSRIKIFSARAAYEDTVLFVLGINLQRACANGPNDTAGNTVPCTSFDRSNATSTCIISGEDSHISCHLMPYYHLMLYKSREDSRNLLLQAQVGTCTIIAIGSYSNLPAFCWLSGFSE